MNNIYINDRYFSFVWEPLLWSLLIRLSRRNQSLITEHTYFETLIDILTVFNSWKISLLVWHANVFVFPRIVFWLFNSIITNFDFIFWWIGHQIHQSDMNFLWEYYLTQWFRKQHIWNIALKRMLCTYNIWCDCSYSSTVDIILRGWTAIKEQQHDKKKTENKKKEQTLSCIHAVIFDFPFCKQITKLQKKMEI